MPDQEKQNKILLWAAKIGGLIVSISWIAVLISASIDALQHGEPVLTFRGILLAILILGSIIGVAIGWKTPEVGGKITIISSLFLSIFSFFSVETNQFFAVTVSGVPFFLVGLLYLQSLADGKEDND
jgi:hypothetical protein